MQKVFLFAAGRLYLLDICDHEKSVFYERIGCEKCRKTYSKVQKR